MTGGLRRWALGVQTAHGARLTGHGSRFTAHGLRLVAVATLTAGLLAQTPAQWQDVIRNLRHPKPDTRLEAVERLGAASYNLAAEQVAMLIADPDDRVQLAAIDAELSFFLADRPDGGFKSRAQAAYESGPLLRVAAPAPTIVIDKLIGAMRDENPRVQFDAVHALGFIAEGPLATPQATALTAELDHYDPTMRAATARVLGRLRTREAGTALLAALEDTNDVVRLFALEALGLIAEPRVAAPARTLAAHGKGDTVPTAMLVLARIGSADDIELFRQSLQHKDARVRRAAAEGLGRAGDTPSIQILARVMQSDKSKSVRLAAAFALQRLGQTQSHVIASMLILDDLRAQARDYLLEVGPAAVPGLQSALKVATDTRHRMDLVRVLGYIGTREDGPVADAYQQDRNEDVRRAAAMAAARLNR
jgi:HEAT repeat protein